MRGLALNLHLKRRQVMTFALHQSLKILQLSELELAEHIRTELERNPVLEEIPGKSSLWIGSDILSQVPERQSLRNHLLTQARESFSMQEEYRIAVHLIDLLDERGLLTTPPDEIPFEHKDVLRVLAVLQTFTPHGVGGRNLQESLLIQLRTKSYSLAEVLVRDYFNDLLHGRFRGIQKSARISSSDFQKALDQISKLRLRPTDGFEEEPAPRWIPDLILKEGEAGWTIRIGKDELPAFRINEKYLSLSGPFCREEKETLRSWIAEAKWLKRSITRRKEVLLKIGKLLLKKNAGYFERGQELQPIPIKELAEFLNVHPSTAWRAVANKTLSCLKGMIELKSFFSESTASDPTKELLRRLIEKEDKKAPYTDDDLSRILQENGLSCARRTVSKYRNALKIRSASQRKC